MRLTRRGEIVRSILIAIFVILAFVFVLGLVGGIEQGTIG